MRLKNRLSFLLAGSLAVLPFGLKAQTLPVTQDSYVVPGGATNFGTAATLNVGGPTGTQGLVQFDLTALPAGAVAKATLVLYVNKLGAAGTVSVANANASWTETMVTGSNAPGAGLLTAGPFPVSTGSSYLSMDITSIVNGWQSGTPNNGLLITAAGGANVAFDSKESTTTSHPAALTITAAPSFAYVYNTLSAVIADGDAIPFDANGLLSGFTHDFASTGITVLNSGTYTATFSVSGVEPNKFGLTVNGSFTPVSGSVYGFVAGTPQNTGQVILVLSAGDVITLSNLTRTAITLQSTSGHGQDTVNASILFLKIQ
jgi:hypothetical protein